MNHILKWAGWKAVIKVKEQHTYYSSEHSGWLCSLQKGERTGHEWWGKGPLLKFHLPQNKPVKKGWE